MRSILAIVVMISLMFGSAAVAADKHRKQPDQQTTAQQAPRPAQTQQVQPAHRGGGSGGQQHCQPPRRDDHQSYNDHRGSFWIDLGRALTTPAPRYCYPQYAPQYPVYQPTYSYQAPVYGGYATAYNVPCVVEGQGDKIVVNRPYAVGTRLTVLGGWATDPNTREPLYRRDQGTLVVEQSNGITSLCSVARGYASRGDDIAIASQPAGY